MSLNDMNTGSYGTTMLVQPAYGGIPMSYGGGLGNLGGFGGDYAWLLLFMILLGGGMWGGMGGFGMGGMMWPMMMGGMGAGYGLDYLYPWLNNSQHISDGFRDQQLNTQIGDLRSDVNRGFGDVQLGIAGMGRQICETGSNITGAIRDGFNGVEIAANGRQIANMQQQFGIQSAIERGTAASAAGIAELKYTVGQEGCADRSALTQGLHAQTMQEMANTNQIVTELRNGFQQMHDEFCADRIEGYKRQVADRDREIDNLNARLTYANSQADRVAQTAQIVDSVYQRLATCPVNTVSVYGNQPVWTCPNNNTCSCNNGFGRVAAQMG